MGDEGAAADTFLLFSTAEVAGLSQCFEGSLEFAGEGSASKDAYHIECATYFINIFPWHGYKDFVCLFVAFK